jgi:hypothetical protein
MPASAAPCGATDTVSCIRFTTGYIPYTLHYLLSQPARRAPRRGQRAGRAGSVMTRSVRVSGRPAMRSAARLPAATSLVTAAADTNAAPRPTATAPLIASTEFTSCGARPRRGRGALAAAACAPCLGRRARRPRGALHERWARPDAGTGFPPARLCSWNPSCAETQENLIVAHGRALAPLPASPPPARRCQGLQRCSHAGTHRAPGQGSRADRRAGRAP